MENLWASWGWVLAIGGIVLLLVVLFIRLARLRKRAPESTGDWFDALMDIFTDHW